MLHKSQFRIRTDWNLHFLRYILYTALDVTNVFDKVNKGNKIILNWNQLLSINTSTMFSFTAIHVIMQWSYLLLGTQIH